MNIADWTCAPESPGLAPDELHVWKASLGPSTGQLESFGNVLNTDERDRRDRFRFKELRQSWSTSRTVLRHIISRYSRIPPAEIQFEHNRYGKPELHQDQNNFDLRFNISHSSDVMVCAISPGMRVGIDIERVREVSDFDLIAGRVFSASGLRHLYALPHEQRLRAFFTCWTRKEAYVKALGLGLSLAPDSFDVTFSPEEPACITRVSDSSVNLSDWLLADLPGDMPFAAAFALEGRISRVKCWLWNWDRPA
jgi:4'-phosphopantetheinyl transferase